MSGIIDEAGGRSLAWKVNCRDCGELVLAKPYCYECGAERPADGDYYVEATRDD